MAIMKDIQILFGQYNIRGDLNQFSLGLTAQEKDDTRFGDSTSKVQAGLDELSISGNGFFAADDAAFKIDDILSADLGSSPLPISVAMPTGAEGDRCHFCKGIVTAYSPNPGAVGDAKVLSFSAESGAGWNVAGRVEKALGSTIITGNSIGSQLGVAASPLKLHAILHVVSQSGTAPTLDVIVESDVSSGFAGPTTRATFAQVTTILTSEAIIPVSDASGDDWWRVQWTLAGGSPDYSFLCAIGIR
ncbi:hypothetical protein LCGC14_2240030 [marine sediment metagenome]|uniref:Uncharacterized protein n=1 Tax=marine sediment metagenome TaxID=412755 RepID=A0A0F9D5X4_9ZZZZ